MIDTQGAVVLGMVYNYLPFMIMPIYTVIDKMDHSVIEAALRSGRQQRQCIPPGHFPPVCAWHHQRHHHGVHPVGVHLCHQPSAGRWQDHAAGRLIEMQFYGNSYNPYLGSAVSLVMMVIVLICMAIMNRFGDGEETAVLL